MPKASTTQVVEFREQAPLADDGAEQTVTAYGHWRCFQDAVAIPVGGDLTWMQTTFRCA
jgi:hypothetical protein